MDKAEKSKMKKENMEKLIKLISGDIKNDEEKVEPKSEKVYRDEPILITASQMKNYTPPMYREMRKIGRGVYYPETAQIFYMQGKFMEDFEDDFDYHGVFMHYYPTYQAMNDLQLRGYFSWRTKVRHGIVKKTSASFAFVYIYELLNQIGVKSPMDGYMQLTDFWDRYKDLDPQLEKYMKHWLTDYVVYYNLDKSLLPGSTRDDNDLHILKNFEGVPDEELFKVLCRCSSYGLGSSRFYTAYQKDVIDVTCRVYRAIARHYNKGGENRVCERLFGKNSIEGYFMFRSAVFYESKKKADCEYQLSETQKMTYKNGNWRREFFFWYGSKNKKFSGLMKSIDVHMRVRYNFKYTLKEVETLKLFTRTIEKEIDTYLAEKEAKKAPPPVKIDFSKLAGIREAALETQSKLIIDDSGDVQEYTSVDNASAVLENIGGTAADKLRDIPLDIPLDTPPFQKLQPTESGNEQGGELAAALSRLTEAESELLHSLLYEKNYEQKDKSLMLSVLADAVNEKLFDVFGDTVMVYETVPELIEDYIEDLKGIIQE